MIKQELFISIVSQFTAIVVGMIYFFVVAAYVFNVQFSPMSFTAAIELFIIVVTLPFIMIVTYRFVQKAFGVENSFYVNDKKKVSSRR